MIWVHNDCICPFYSFHENKSYQYLLLDFLSPWSNLRLRLCCLCAPMTFIIIFCLSVKGPVSLCPFNLSSSFLLSLQYLFKFVTLLYHYSMLLGGYFTSINFLLIILFILCLNFSTSSCYDLGP